MFLGLALFLITKVDAQKSSASETDKTLFAAASKASICALWLSTAEYMAIAGPELARNIMARVVPKKVLAEAAHLLHPCPTWEPADAH